MKILQVNCVYGKGSTGKITKDIHCALLEQNIESYVCYGRGSLVADKNVKRVSSDITSRMRKVIASINGMPYRFSPWTNKRLEREIDDFKPDIVHLQCINGYFVDIYRLLLFLKKRNIPTVLTLHAEFMYTGGCGYALACEQWVDGCKKCGNLRSGLGVRGFDRVKQNYRKMLKSISGFENLTVVGVSDWISQRAKKSAIMKECRVLTIHNGIETKNIFCPRTSCVKDKYNIPSDKKMILSVVPSLTSELKGGKLMMKLAQQCRRDDCVFVIVGAREVVENTQKNLIIIPYTESQLELAALYSASDVFVMGSAMDNFPTVCLEANSCGTPVVGYDVGGVSETISPGMGCVVQYGNETELWKKIEEWIDKKQRISAETLENVRYKNSKERMVADYLSLYRELMGENYGT